MVSDTHKKRSAVVFGFRVHSFNAAPDSLPVRARFLRNFGELMELSSAQEVAGHCEVSVQSVYRWIRGVSFPDPEMIDLIASFYGVDVTQLFYDPDHEIDCEMVAPAIRKLAKSYGFTAVVKKDSNVKSNV